MIRVFKFWRWERDSNPRNAINVYTLSRRAPSATRTPHHRPRIIAKKTSCAKLKQLICRKTFNVVLWFAKMLVKNEDNICKALHKKQLSRWLHWLRLGSFSEILVPVRSMHCANASSPHISPLAKLLYSASCPWFSGAWCLPSALNTSWWSCVPITTAKAGSCHCWH